MHTFIQFTQSFESLASLVALAEDTLLDENNHENWRARAHHLHSNLLELSTHTRDSFIATYCQFAASWTQAALAVFCGDFRPERIKALLQNAKLADQAVPNHCYVLQSYTVVFLTILKLYDVAADLVKVLTMMPLLDSPVYAAPVMHILEPILITDAILSRLSKDVLERIVLTSDGIVIDSIRNNVIEKVTMELTRRKMNLDCSH